MSFNDVVTTPLLAKLFLAISTATVLGGGTMLLTAHRDNAVQDVRIDRAELSLDKIEKLDEKLDATNANIQVLRTEMEVTRVRIESSR